MASCAMLEWCRRCRFLFTSYRSLLVRHTQAVWATTYFASAALAFAHCQSKPNIGLQTPDVSKLKQENLLKAAADQNIGAVTLMLIQTTQALLQAEEKYKQTVKRLTALLEHHLTVLGRKEVEEEVWADIVQGRHRVDVCRNKIQELQLLFTFVQKLTEAAVEVACLTGSDVSSQSLEDQMSGAQDQVNAARQHSLHLERHLQEVHAHSIKVIAEHAEKEEKKRKEKLAR